MKKILILLITFLSLSIQAQTNEYEVTSYLEEGFKAPNTNYLGEAWLNQLIRSDESLSYNITKATFKANSTLNWHKHTDRQVLIVVSGKGYYQEKGKQPIVIKEGDILNIDVTVIKDGWHGDTSKMYLVGKCQPHNERLVKITQECLYKAIEVVKPGGYLGDIGHAIQQHAESNYYSVVEDYCGHGIGNVYHEEPQILHYGKPGKGTQILEGMCFTIEPIINQGSKYCKTLQDGWTVETKDGRNSAQWEHTLAVTKNGVEVLTKRHEESI